MFAGRPGLSMIVSIEKRFNFILQDRAVKASNYEHWLSQLERRKATYASVCTRGSDNAVNPTSLEHKYQLKKHSDKSFCLSPDMRLDYKLLDLTLLPQWFQYKRGHDHEICILELTRSGSCMKSVSQNSD